MTVPAPGGGGGGAWPAGGIVLASEANAAVERDGSVNTVPGGKQERRGNVFLTALVIAGWYFSNIGLTITNKVLLSEYAFRFPIFLSACHMLCCAALSQGAALSGCIALHRVHSLQQLSKIALLAVVFLASICLGNTALNYIPVSFDQAIGATTPAFTALLSFLLFSQRESRRTYLTLVPVVVGIIIASQAEPLFHIVGFLAGVAAVNTRALKSVLQGRLLAHAEEKMDSMSLLGYMAPISVIFLLPMAAVFEPGALEAARGLDQGFWTLLGCNSLLAFATNLTNFLVTHHTSALTLQVLGNAKGVVAVVLSLLYFRNPTNVQSIGGYALCVCGVYLYSRAKMAAVKEQQYEQLATREAQVGAQQA